MKVQICLAPTEYDVAAPVWAEVMEDDGELTVVLPYNYPDPAPAVGWWVAHKGRDYEVTWVDDRQPYQLECRLKGSA